MNRSEFIKGSCGVCIALSSGFLASAVLSSCKTQLGVVKAASKDDMVDIPLAEFDKTTYKLVRVSNFDYDLAIQKKTDGSFDILLLECTHAGQPLTRTGKNYYCTLHGSQFDHEGHVTKGPAENNLKKLRSKTEKDKLIIYLT